LKPGGHHPEAATAFPFFPVIPFFRHSLFSAMHTMIHPSPSERRHRPAPRADTAQFRRPIYDCREQGDAVTVVVYVPGVDASGVDIEARGADLTVTARKTQFVRVNWTALQLERVQRDYQLRLRLGLGFDYAAMQAEIDDGVLTVTLPKRPAQGHAGAGARLLRVA
jgi:HSP20 family protein